MATHARIDLTNGKSVAIDRLPGVEELTGGGLVSVRDMSGNTVLVNRTQIVSVTAVERDETASDLKEANGDQPQRKVRASPQPWDA